MLTIDGSEGEGGGQILRTALALSVLTRTPFRLEKIRAGRSKPGLMRQHLTAVRAAASIGNAIIRGDEIGSGLLEFSPRGIVAGEHRFSVGSAGSATLVLQTVLPPLLQADAPSTLTFEGGTHNPLAPSFDYLDRVFLPVLEKMGARVERTLHRHGFYPAGGGRFTVVVTPTKLQPLELLTRGAIRTRRATAIFSGVPFAVAQRELDAVKQRLGWSDDELRPRQVDSAGPGNVIALELEWEHATELFDACGERGVSAEEVALQAITDLAEFVDDDVPVGPHLADQLLLPFVLAGRGAFRTARVTEHTRTQCRTIQRFLPTSIKRTDLDGRRWLFEVG